VDNNCNGQIDENFIERTFYRDSDADGYGNIAFTVLACTAPAGYVANAKDCNDMNAVINPAAVEVCDGKDNNCNGLIDEGATGGPLVQACYTGLTARWHRHMQGRDADLRKGRVGGLHWPDLARSRDLRRRGQQLQQYDRRGQCLCNADDVRCGH